MATISIVPADLCVRIDCGAGESDVSLTVASLYKAWKDWFVTSDNSKYLPAFDSAGGDPVGASSLDNIYFLKTADGWKICPQTVEPEVIVRLDGNLFPDVPGNPLFGYDFVVAGGHTHIETTVSTSARLIETGVSGLTAEESAQLAQIANVPTNVWSSPTRTLTSGGTVTIDASDIWDYTIPANQAPGTVGDKMMKLPVGVGFLGNSGKSKLEMEREQKLIDTVEKVSKDVEELKTKETVVEREIEIPDMAPAIVEQVKKVGEDLKKSMKSEIAAAVDEAVAAVIEKDKQELDDMEAETVVTALISEANTRDPETYEKEASDALDSIMIEAIAESIAKAAEDGIIQASKKKQ